MPTIINKNNIVLFLGKFILVGETDTEAYT